MNNDAAGEKTNPQHEIFISEMVSHGNRRIAYQKAYPETSDRSARTSAARLLAQPHIAARIRSSMVQMQVEAVETLKETYKGRLADIIEKRAVLAQIIRGELVTVKEVTKKGITETIRYKCDPKERIRAIILDNKLEEEWTRALTIPDEGVRHIE